MTSNPGCGARFLIASIGCVFASYASVASAQAPPLFTPHAYAGYIHDSNLFRLSGEDDAGAILDGRDKAVGALQYGAGLDIGIPLSLQYFELNLNAIRNEYDDYDELDHTVLLARGRWGWVWGRLWSGDVRLRYREDIAPFEEFERPVKDERTLLDLWLSGTRKLQPRWVLDLAAGYNELDHGFEPRRSLNRGIALAIAEIAWLGAGDSESRLGLRSENRRVFYDSPEIVAGNPVDNSHTEYEVSATLVWETTARSTWAGHVGYALLRHDEFTDRDFSGPTARIEYVYGLTERTGLEAGAWRDLNVRPNTSASYVKETGVSLRPFWLYSDKLTIEASLSLEDRRFEGDPALGVGPVETRKDDVRLTQIAMKYAPYERLFLEFTYTTEDLDSNRAERNYRYHTIAGNVQMEF